MLKEFDILTHIKNIAPKQLLICTHTLDLSLLENQFLSKFIQDYETKCVIVTSETGLEESLETGVVLSGIGVDYALYTIRNFPYVFHPKIFLYVNQKEEIEILVGGTNFTYKGLCLNSDAVDYIDSATLSLTSSENLRKFLLSLSESIKQSEFTKFIDLLIGKCVHDDDYVEEKIFLSNIEKSIFEQVKNLILEPVIKLQVISPYFDHDMTALLKLQEELGAIGTEILMNNHNTEINLSKIPKDIKIYTHKSERFLHAKILLIYTKDGASILVGSANCTTPGLIRTNEKGNWETAIFNRKVEISFANDLWNSYIPQKLFENERWDYVPPKPSKDTLNKVFFTSNLHGKKLTIDFVPTTLRDTIEVTIHGLSIDGICFTRTQLIQDEPKLNITLHENEIQAIQSKPVLIEMRNHGELIGRNWLIQHSELQKSKTLKSIERWLGQIVADPFGNSDIIIEIAEFLAKYFIPVGSTTRYESEYIRNKNLNNINNKSQTIYQIIEEDSSIAKKFGGCTPHEFHDLGEIIKNFLSKEIDFFLPESDDEIPEDDYESSIVNHESVRTRTNQNLKIKDTTRKPNEREKITLLDRLPRFEIIFNEMIIARFNLEVLKGNLPPVEQLQRFESLMELLILSYDYIEFFRVRLPKRLSLLDMNEQYRLFMRESATLFWWFWDEVYTHFNNQFDEELEYILTKNHFFLERNIDLMCIYWVCNYHHNNLKGSEHLALLVSQLRTKCFFGLPTTEPNINHQYFYSNSICPTATDITSHYKSIIEDMELYLERKAAIGNCLSRILKVHYWENAKSFHENAVIILQPKGSEKIHLISNHEKKRIISEKNMEILKSSSKECLGHMYDERIFNRKIIFSASEIHNSFIEFLCPRKNCHQSLPLDAFIKLNKFEYLECPNCNSLILPVNIEDKYNSRDVPDSEWNLE